MSNIVQPLKLEELYVMDKKGYIDVSEIKKGALNIASLFKVIASTNLMHLTSTFITLSVLNEC